MVISQGIVLEGANQKKAFATLHVGNSEFWKTPAPKLDYKPLPPVARSFTFTETYVPKAFTPEEFWAPKTLADYYEALTRSDIGNSPFYYWLLHYWLEVFGLSDYSARAFSVIFSVLIIGLTYLFARRFFSQKVGLIAAGIVAVEPFFIAYSHQARNYSMTFFLTFLATYFFLAIIENRNSGWKTFWLYIGYVVSAGLGMLSHFLVIAVLLSHAVYALFFLRDIKTWFRMVIAAPAVLAGVAWWMIFGGGQYTLYSLNHQAALYKRMAEENPGNNPFGALPATFTNVFNKSLPVFSDLILFTNGLTDALLGKRNTIIAILVGFILIVWYRYSESAGGKRILGKVSSNILALIPIGLVLASLILYNNHRLQFGILSVSIFALSFIPDLHNNQTITGKKRLWLLYMMGLIPTLFLVVMAIKNGHTYGITQRYSGFSFPFVILLLSLLLVYYAKLEWQYKVLIYGFFAMQLYFVSYRLVELYEDRSAKYNYFATPRVSNPYTIAAQKIVELYQPGDTVMYPAPITMITSEMDRTYLPFSIQDAQFTNLYLPKTAQYIQVMDTTQTEKILLKRKIERDTLVIMNLKGLRYGFQ